MDYIIYPYWGMNLIWWFVWAVLLFWIFATPYAVPGERRKKDSAMDILNKQLALGQIKNEIYKEKKALIES